MDPRPGEDFSSRSLAGLRDVRGPRRPLGYRPGLQLEERLLGLLLVLLGVAGCVLAVAILRGSGPVGLRAGGPAVAAPLGCLVPFVALGSLGLIVVGGRRFLDP